ncbi:MAG: BlaI/MecI/CopY family transcriptional regulator [Clostridia bacterium]|nr:BlaI/MecI/CopY family transcriptional regulator [Clostridia bacterium]
MKTQRLPDAEFDLMQVIWEQKPPVTTSLLMERIGHARSWKVQTMVTLLARLTERGFLRVERPGGRDRAFYPIISRGEYLRMETEAFLGHYHRNSVSSLIAALADEPLTEEDLDELSALIRRARERSETHE